MCRIRTIVFCTKIANQRQKYDDSEQCKICLHSCRFKVNISMVNSLPTSFLFSFFNFYQSFLSHTLMIHGITREGREPFVSSIPLPPALKHLGICCTWDDYHMFFFVSYVNTRLLLDEIYHLGELPFKGTLMQIWKSTNIFIWK